MTPQSEWPFKSEWNLKSEWPLNLNDCSNLNNSSNLNDPSISMNSQIWMTPQSERTLKSKWPLNLIDPSNLNDPSIWIWMTPQIWMILQSESEWPLKYEWPLKSEWPLNLNDPSIWMTPQIWMSPQSEFLVFFFIPRSESPLTNVIFCKASEDFVPFTVNLFFVPHNHPERNVTSRLSRWWCPTFTLANMAKVTDDLGCNVNSLMSFFYSGLIYQ